MVDKAALRAGFLKHSTDFSTIIIIIIIRGWYNRPFSGLSSNGLGSTPPQRGGDKETTTHFHLAPKVKTGGAIPPLPNTSSLRGA
jgi:hypothetical protein